jgi:hypothetical protein
MGFEKEDLHVSTKDGHNFILLEPLVYVTKSGKRIVVPAGATTDGASVPRGMWNLFPPFGSYWLAAVLHDGMYRLLKLPKAECDSILLEAMLTLGTSKEAAKVIYAGVFVGGEHAYDEDQVLRDKAVEEAFRNAMEEGVN